MLPTKKDETSNSTDEDEDILQEIADIILWQNAGFPTDWAAYDFEYQELCKTWREAEATVIRFQSAKLQAFIEDFGSKK